MICAVKGGHEAHIPRGPREGQTAPQPEGLCRTQDHLHPESKANSFDLHTTHAKRAPVFTVGTHGVVSGKVTVGLKPVEATTCAHVLHRYSMVSPASALV